ncbi:hypothetical protein SAMN05216298_0432 [Glycomyces sambucus]|uniref:DUF1963 domain-containing protein n=2 Tax=Glycomyces sambucus TaxID=380244 RepID=A0A1G9CNX7_9ACTN|nr:hypothetical protein SAMN05216298_0432 [Glycomyces sambucus]
MLTSGGTPAPDAPVLRTGGVPLVPPGFTWPACAECEGAMQFIAHLPLDDGAVAVFYCQNAGMCDDWDATSGANRAFLFTEELQAAEVPTEGDTLLGAVTLLHPEAAPAPDDVVLGQLGGEPEWIQNDETPTCPRCAAPMTFTAALEEGLHHDTAANFGCGCGYVFTCRDCSEAAFLWQR